MTQREPSHGLVLSLIAGSALWACLLAAHDTWRCHSLSNGFTALPTLGALAALATGALVSSLVPLALVRGALQVWAGERVLRRGLVGALEGALSAWLACFVQEYATVSDARRWAAAVAVVLVSTLASVLAPRMPRSARFGSVLLLGVVFASDAWFPIRKYPWLRLALDLNAAIAFVLLALPLLARVKRSAVALLCGASVVLALATPHIVRASMPARGLLHDLSLHARAQALLLDPWWSPDSGGMQSPVEVCAEALDRDATCADPPIGASAASGAARGADVLMLSVDALRWDHAEAFPELSSVLGQRVRFRRAVSPAPRTLFALAGVLRGRPLRQVALIGRRVRPDAAPTLGSVLTSHGYRAVLAPTDRYLESSTGVADGFEQLVEPALLPRLTEMKPRRFPLASAMDQLLRAARETPVPLLAWLHAMETHLPYHWDGGSGPTSKAGQLHAARDLDKKLAAFVRAYKKARLGRRLVIALFADHGEEFGEHGGSAHASTVYAEQVRVMFELVAPGLGARDVEAPVSTAAIPATLLDLLGIERPCSFTLPSLLPCIADGAKCPSLAVSELLPLSDGSPARIAYTGARYRLLYDLEHDVTRLHDADSDPYDQRDLSASQPKTLARLSAQARAWDARYCISPADLP